MDPLQDIETPYIDAQTLLNLFSSYSKPRERILRLVKNGTLIRLKNGLYLVANKIRRGVPFEQVANWLYGPSYVSMEWALSFYGMIPERVHVVTSMTLGRNKEYRTPVGDFIYSKISPEAYSIGITQKKTSDSVSSFLMATPEKALADFVFKNCKGRDKTQLKIELIESCRIDPSLFQKFDKSLLIEIGNCYQDRSVDQLINVIG